MTNEWDSIAKQAPEIQATKNEVLNPVVLELVKKYSKGKTLFDYGCGWGEFADLASKEGFNVTAFDDADEMVAQARDKYENPTFLLRSEFEEQQRDLLGRFDVVTTNLVLCILEPEEHGKLVATAKSLLKDDGVLVLSLCHPKYDYLPDSLVSTRFIPEGASYNAQFRYEKVIKENGIRFGDYHRPIEHYKSLFKDGGLEIVEARESLTLGTMFSPDFIIFALKI